MTAIKQNVLIDESRRHLWLSEPLPETIPCGAARVVLTFIGTPPSESSAGHEASESPPAPPNTLRRIGFLKGKISCPPDFDTMGEDEIIAMFEGET